jgi:hypothetical protein
MEDDIIYNDVVSIERVDENTRKQIQKKEEQKKAREQRDPLDLLADDLGDE